MHSIRLFKNLKSFLTLYQVIPLSTASCERGFSKMNLIKTDIRNKLGDRNLLHHMMISINNHEFFSKQEDIKLADWNSKKKYIKNFYLIYDNSREYR